MEDINWSLVTIFIGCTLKISEGSVCHSIDSGKIVTFCCNNHEEKNGRCVGCETGFISVDGEPCRPCGTGSYGIKCIKPCLCPFHSCHHITGCANFDFASTETQSVTEELNNGRVTHVTRSARSTSPSLQHNDIKGQPERKYILLIIGLGGLTIFVVSLAFGLYSYRKKYRKTNIRTVNAGENEVGNELVRQNSYDTIDESTMYEENVILNRRQRVEIPTDQVSTSSDSDNSQLESPVNEGYLNPYQIIVSDHHPHEYDKPKHDNDSSGSFGNYRNSGYIHPYQRLHVNKVQEHPYTKYISSKRKFLSKYGNFKYFENTDSHTLTNVGLGRRPNSASDIHIIWNDNKSFNDFFTKLSSSY